MQALQIQHHGPVTDLTVTDVPARAIGSGEVRVEIHAAGVNPSDVASVEGRFPDSPLPRIVGRDFAGRVVEGPPDLLGQEVWGSGGDLGIVRDGTHAESVVLPRDGVALRPARLSVEEAAVAGVPFVTASTALEAGRLASGDWVIVSGAAGAVGSAAIQVARARGACVVALVRDAGEKAQLADHRIDAVAVSERSDVAEVARAATGGRGADLALNGVGGAVFQPLLDALAAGGRLVVYSAAGGREVSLDLLNLYRRRLKLVGVNTAAAGAVECARILTDLVPLFTSGALQPLPVLERYKLSDAARAYARVAGGAPGKIVLIPDRYFDA